MAPISLRKIHDIIDASVERMEPDQRRLWDAIKIDPVRWKLNPWGNGTKGFWVVGIYGNRVIWYNEIEDGFNRSMYSSVGDIGEYWCRQDALEWTVQHVLREIVDGVAANVSRGAPEPLENT